VTSGILAKKKSEIFVKVSQDFPEQLNPGPFVTTTTTVCGSSMLVNFVLLFPKDFNDRLWPTVFLSFSKARPFFPNEKSFSLQWQCKNRKLILVEYNGEEEEKIRIKMATSHQEPIWSYNKNLNRKLFCYCFFSM